MGITELFSNQSHADQLSIPVEAEPEHLTLFDSQEYQLIEERQRAERVIHAIKGATYIYTDGAVETIPLVDLESSGI
jgi:hypothetical protein